MSQEQDSNRQPIDEASDAVYEDPDAVLARLRSAAQGEDRKDRYEIIEEISRGGMGVIYKVRDREMRRKLAMKTLRPRSAQHDAAHESSRTARFLEEAQIAAQLEHPNIVPIHEMGLDSEGRLFFTMQLVQGDTLEEVFQQVGADQGDWNLPRALATILRVCEAMAFAHQRGVIHRDLKPANIMVGRFGETYVMDWGLAKILGHDDSLASRTPTPSQSVLSSARQDAESKTGSSELGTMAGSVLGTPSYMPPEQARGDLDALGPRSDVYSVGAILHHLLHGAAPYNVPGESRSPVEILEMVMAGPPPSPAAASVPAELDAIREKAMQRRPEDRYHSMLDMARDLRAFLENRVVRAYRTGAWVEFVKWIQRNRGMAAGFLLAMAMAMGGLAVVGWVQTRARAELTVLNEGLESANADLEQANDKTRLALQRSEAAERELRWRNYVANLSACISSFESGVPREAANRLAACPEEHRGWEWQFLKNRVDTSTESFEGATHSFVMSVAWSPDGSLIAGSTGTGDNMSSQEFVVRLWDAITFDLVEEIDGHDSTVRFLEFSPSGEELASSSRGLILVSDVYTGEPIYQHESGRSIQFHADGEQLIAGWGEVQYADLRSGRPGFGTEDLGVRRMAPSPRGDRLALGCWDGRVALWDDPPRRKFWEVDLIEGTPESTDFTIQGVLDLKYLEDGRIVAALQTGDVAVLGNDGTLQATLRGHRRPVNSLATSPDEDRLASGADDGTIRLWDLGSYGELDVWYGHDGAVMSVDYSPDGEQVVSSSSDRTLRFWSTHRGHSETRMRGPGFQGLGWYGFSDFDRRGRVLWQPDRYSARVTDARSGLDLVALPSGRHTMHGAAFIDDGARIVSVRSMGHLRIWDSESGEFGLRLR